MLIKQNRLIKQTDFKKIYQKGIYLKGNFINLKFIKNNLIVSRFGVVIGLKISKKANQRNKVKRQITEIIRLKIDKIKPGFDIIILPQIIILEKNYNQIELELIQLLKQYKLIND